MQAQRTFYHFTSRSVDYLLVVVSFLAAALIFDKLMPNQINSWHFLIVFFLLMIWTLSTKATMFYNDYRSRNFSIEIITLAKNVFIQLLSTLVILYLMNEVRLSKTFPFIYALTLFTLIGIEKYAMRRFLYYMRKKGRNLRNILIIGAGENGMNFYETLKSNAQFGYRVIGFLDDKKNYLLNGQYLGPIEKLEEILLKKVVDNVIVALPNSETEKIEDITRICDHYTTRVTLIPDYVRYVSNRYKISMFGRLPVINIREEKLREYHWKLLKRTFDITFSLFIIVFVFTWLFPLIAAAIKLNSPGPVFFKQERWGERNRKFKAYKFRSMVVQSKDVNEKGKYQQATKDDPRITKVGSILRKTNLDELPQFINVLLGDMSVVGPRPHPTPLNLESKDKINLYMVRHFVKPGLTGWAQVNGLRGETKEEELMRKRVGYDLWYIENWSFWLDIQIVFLTAWRMVVGDPNAY